MPFFKIEYAIPFTTSQQDDLAEAITRIYSQAFTVPRNFVNVKFIDVSKDIDYIGGKRRIANHIHANVRTGPSRSKKDWENLCQTIEQAWYDIAARSKGVSERDLKLRSMVMHGSITAGQEAGFMFPEAGGDVQWLHDNWKVFNEKANAGDEEFRELVEELKARGIMKDSNGVNGAQV